MHLTETIHQLATSTGRFLASSDGMVRIGWAMAFATPTQMDRSVNPLDENPFSGTTLDPIIAGVAGRLERGVDGVVEVELLFEGVAAHLGLLVERYRHANDWPWRSVEQTLAAISYMNDMTESAYWRLLDLANQSDGRLKVIGRVTPCALHSGLLIRSDGLAFRLPYAPSCSDLTERVERYIKHEHLLEGKTCSRRSYAGVCDELAWVRQTCSVVLPDTKADYEAMLKTQTRRDLASCAYGEVMMTLWMTDRTMHRTYGGQKLGQKAGGAKSIEGDERRSA